MLYDVLQSFDFEEKKFFNKINDVGEEFNYYSKSIRCLNLCVVLVHDVLFMP